MRPEIQKLIEQSRSSRAQGEHIVTCAYRELARIEAGGSRRSRQLAESARRIRVHRRLRESLRLASDTTANPMNLRPNSETSGRRT